MRFQVASVVHLLRVMLTLTPSLRGWIVAYRLAGVTWWSVQYRTEAEALKALRRLEESRNGRFQGLRGRGPEDVRGPGRAGGAAGRDKAEPAEPAGERIKEEA